LARFVSFGIFHAPVKVCFAFLPIRSIIEGVSLCFFRFPCFHSFSFNFPFLLDLSGTHQSQVLVEKQANMLKRVNKEHQEWEKTNETLLQEASKKQTEVWDALNPYLLLDLAKIVTRYLSWGSHPFFPSTSFLSSHFLLNLLFFSLCRWGLVGQSMHVSTSAALVTFLSERFLFCFRV
jgi:hypothetical protein